jgi:ABC-type Fe3+-hydroxamate transport system, periplasmic component
MTVENTTYPLEFTDGYGDISTITKEPQRIISLSPNITEVLCSIGLESKIVGRTDYCDYPETIASVESVGQLTTPNTEKIIELQPDVIITDGMQDKEFVVNLRNLGITVICLRQNQTIEGTYEILNNAGLITNTNQKSAELVENMKTEIQKIEGKVKNVDKKTVFYAVDFGDYGIYTAGAGTYIDELFTKCGLDNIAKDSEGWTYSLEKLYENDPDIIICSKFYGTKDNLMSYAPFKDLKAIKNGNIVEIDNNQIDRQTARNVDAMKELVEKIYDKK